MGRLEKLLLKIISGKSDNNIDFKQIRDIIVKYKLTDDAE